MPITELHCLDLLDRKKFYNQHNIFYELFKNIFEIDNELFNNTLKLWISNTNFNKSGFKLSPDFIRYAIIVLKMNLFFKIYKKKKTTYCYFTINNQKKKIRTQDWFSYNLIYTIKKKLKKNIKK